MSAALAAALGQALGCAVAAAPAAAVGGGCISSASRWETNHGPVFVKLMAKEQAPILQAEADGLARLAQCEALRVPAVRAQGEADGQCFLALEWLDLSAPDAGAEQCLGEALAFLHREQAVAFGLERDNYIGATAQPNSWLKDWCEFWREQRLRHQLQLAAANGYGGRLQERGARLLEVFDVFFSSYRPVPSLLHGDLWSGNRAALADGTPVMFDPAVYYGDREADIAMTRLFGGFGPRFYAAYVGNWPLDAAAGTRRELYNLYHVLNHLNLFGGSYGAQAEGMIDRLLAAAGA